HHTQLLATPFSRTRLVTRLGVSVLNVVATIDTPTSHHGAARPDVKNSAVLRPARRASRIAGRNEIAIERATIVQSSVVSCTGGGLRAVGSAGRLDFPLGGGKAATDNSTAESAEGAERRTDVLLGRRQTFGESGLRALRGED